MGKENLSLCVHFSLKGFGCISNDNQKTPLAPRKKTSLIHCWKTFISWLNWILYYKMRGWVIVNIWCELDLAITGIHRCQWHSDLLLERSQSVGNKHILAGASEKMSSGTPCFDQSFNVFLWTHVKTWLLINCKVSVFSLYGSQAI